MEAGAVRYAHKGNAGLGIAPGLDPAFDSNGRIGRRLAAEDIDAAQGNCGSHDECLPESVREREFYLVRAVAPGAGQEFRKEGGPEARICAGVWADALGRRVDAGGWRGNIA